MRIAFFLHYRIATEQPKTEQDKSAQPFRRWTFRRWTTNRVRPITKAVTFSIPYHTIPCSFKKNL